MCQGHSRASKSSNCVDAIDKVYMQLIIWTLSSDFTIKNWTAVGKAA